MCRGPLKPDVVFFGENVPKDRVQRCYDWVEAADVLLVAGTSLTVQSGLRFVRRAAREGIPVVLVNRGPTRGDDLVDVRIDAGCSLTLTALTEPARDARPPPEGAHPQKRSVLSVGRVSLGKAPPHHCARPSFRRRPHLVRYP